MLPKAGKRPVNRLKSKFDELEKELENLKGQAGQKAGKVRDDLAEKLAALQREIEILSQSIK